MKKIKDKDLKKLIDILIKNGIEKDISTIFNKENIIWLYDDICICKEDKTGIHQSFDECQARDRPERKYQNNNRPQ